MKGQIATQGDRPSGSKETTILPHEKREETNTLLELIGQEDHTAFARLYQNWDKWVYKRAYRYMGNEPDACEVAGTIFRKIWTTASKFDRSRGSGPQWIFAVTQNTCYDAIEHRQQRRATRITPALVDKLADPRNDFSTAEERMDVERALSAARSLPAPQRQAITMAFEGFTDNEIAQSLKAPLGTIKSRLRLGLTKLRDRFRRESA